MSNKPSFQDARAKLSAVEQALEKVRAQEEQELSEIKQKYAKIKRHLSAQKSAAKRHYHKQHFQKATDEALHDFAIIVRKGPGKEVILSAKAAASAFPKKTYMWEATGYDAAGKSDISNFGISYWKLLLNRQGKKDGITTWQVYMTWVSSYGSKISKEIASQTFLRTFESSQEEADAALREELAVHLRQWRQNEINHGRK